MQHINKIFNQVNFRISSTTIYVGISKALTNLIIWFDNEIETRIQIHNS